MIHRLKLIDQGYPEQLKHIDQPPAQLYFVGVPPQEWISLPKVALVGSRKVTSYGQRVTDNLARELAHAGVVIISGLAFGVDTLAHKGALNVKGLTVAVLGGSLERIYPVANQSLAREIAVNGCLISEYPQGHPIRAYQFIARNRLISALSDVVVVVEAAAGSGSLHTAQFGLDQGRTVMAVPGPIDQPSHVGCNRLIKSGALPVTSTEDIFLALGIEARSAHARTARFNSSAEECIYQLLQQESLDMDQLGQAAKLSAAELNQTLTSLELAGYIRPLGAGQWSIK